jgi:hypothetical protein
MTGTGAPGAMPANAMILNGAELAGELVRRGGRALSIPFGRRRMVVAFQLVRDDRSDFERGLTPEFEDGELARFAARSGAGPEPAWERSLAIQYGGHRRF